MTMVCNGTFTKLDGDQVMIGKCTVLATVALILISGNAIMFYRLSHRGGKWVASDHFLRVIASVGLLNGAVNVTLYMVTMATGRWLFGDLLCQIYGVVGSCLSAVWPMLLALMAAERFVKLRSPSEHHSMYSKVNTKILIGGVFLLIIILYLAPIYGWAEYSYFKGKLDLIINVINTTSGTRFEISMEVNRLNEMLNTTVYSEVLEYLTRSGEIVTRQSELTLRGLIVPLRVANSGTLQCLWEHYESGLLQEQLLQILLPNMESESYNSTFGFLINEPEYIDYRDKYMTYQADSTCGLDMTSVNKNTYTFILFCWVCSLLAPCIFVAYVYGRLFYAGVNNLCIFNVRERHTEVVRVTKVLAAASFFSFICDVPYAVSSLMSGLGWPMPPGVLFSVTVLLHMRCSLVSVFYLSTDTSSRINCNCLCSLVRFLYNSCSHNTVDSNHVTHSVKQGLFYSSSDMPILPRFTKETAL